MTRLKLGSIGFINSLPVDQAMLQGKVRVEADIVQGTPAELNRAMEAGHLDLGPVSAFFYGQHQAGFLLMPGVSISSDSAVQSVLLFTRHSFDGLKNTPIYVTDQGRTTPALLEILCRLRYRFLPDLRWLDAGRVPGELPKDSEAVLLIGDEALIHRAKLESQGMKAVDLAEEWRAWTGCPFVFAVWAVRRDVFARDPKAVHAVHEAILRSKEWGLSHLGEVLREAKRRSSLGADDLEEYFSRLSYDLDEDTEKGMRLYFSYAVKCGLIEKVTDIEDIGGHRRSGTRDKGVVCQ